MRHALAALILTAVASATYAQDEKKADAPKGDLAKIQGKWTAMVGPEKNIPLTIEFKGTTANIAVSINGEDRTIKGEVKIDETKSPKEWDWTKFEGPDGQKVEDNLSIYKIEGDTLTVCSGGPGNERPKEFKAGDGGPPNLVELTRVKDEPKKDK